MDPRDLDQEFIARWAEPVSRPRPGIYFLVRDNEVVYVGRSDVIHYRIYTHAMENLKDFDRFFWIPCERAEMIALETYFINKLQPIYNRTSPTGRPRADRPREGLFRVGKEWRYRFRIGQEWVEDTVGDLPFHAAHAVMQEHRKNLLAQRHGELMAGSPEQAEIDAEFIKSIRGRARDGQRKKRTA